MKLYLLPLIFITTLSANCNKALQLYDEAIHLESHPNAKLKKLNRANGLCPQGKIQLDIDILLAGGGVPMDLKELQRINASLDGISSTHRANNTKKLNRLLGVNYDGSLKAVEFVGGSYALDLRFSKDSAVVRKNDELEEAIAKVASEVSQKSRVLFGLEGYASSDGSYEHNKKLSIRRAKALKAKIVAKHPNIASHLKIFGNGESGLVCEGGFLPEKNSNGEYACITKEDVDASRRVTIRRVR